MKNKFTKIALSAALSAMSATDNPALAVDVGPGWSIQATAFNPNRSANVGNGHVESDSSWFGIPGGTGLVESTTAPLRASRSSPWAA